MCPFKANQLILGRIRGGLKKGTFSTIASTMAHPKRQPGKLTVKSSNNNPCTRSRPRIVAFVHDEGIRKKPFRCLCGSTKWKEEEDTDSVDADLIAARAPSL
jgi:hypothetical protein